MHSPLLGVMQGRLVPPESGRFQSFPRLRWRDEFALAEAAGLDTIEWIYDSYGEDVNPLATDAGVREIAELSAEHHVAVNSVCADWFMDFPLLRIDRQEAERRWERLRWLMQRCAKLGITRIVMPFVDSSAIRSRADIEQIVAGVRSVSTLIDSLHVELHLETSLAPAPFASLLSEIDHPLVKVNYDSGNSASLGFNAVDEIREYGSRIGSVHIKDRLAGGGTVPLGEGAADFTALLQGLAAVDYNGDFILQVARGLDGDELEWARHNGLIARRMIDAFPGAQVAEQEDE